MNFLKSNPNFLIIGGGIGSAIAELAIEGQTRFDLESFRTDRFGHIDAFSSEWMQRCANARSKKG